MEGDSDLLLSSLSRGVDRLAAFVNDLLDLGRVEDATLAMRVGPMDVTEALRAEQVREDPTLQAMALYDTLLQIPQQTELSTLLRLVVASAAELLGAQDRKSTRLNSSHIPLSRMPSSA